MGTEKFKIGKIEVGKVESIEKTVVNILFENNFKGFLHISDVSDYYISDLNYIFKVGGEYQFKILQVYKKSKKIKLDWKSIHPRFQRNPFSHIIKETEMGFDCLYSKTMKEIEND